LSMSPALIPGAKQAVRVADASAARGLADEALAAESAAAVRRLLAAAVTPAGASAG
jgi:phosphoenolpyruvate-protein kinase (PTS system EI component)